MNPIHGDDEIDAGWGDKILKVRGIMPIVVILLAASLWFSGVLLVKQAELPIAAIETHVDTTSVQHGALSGILSEQRAATAKEHLDLLKTQERIADSLDAQVFYLSKTEKERAKYKIEMPDSLRKKLIQAQDAP
jgi:hypothetical protein